MQRLRRVTSAVLSTIILGGCGGAHPTVCTLIGCDSGAYFVLPAIKRLWQKARTVRVCMASVCRETTAARARLIRITGQKLNQARTVTLTVEILANQERPLYRAARSATVTKLQPNGVRCGPICYSTQAAIDPASREFTTDPARVNAIRKDLSS